MIMEDERFESKINESDLRQISFEMCNHILNRDFRNDGLGIHYHTGIDDFSIEFEDFFLASVRLHKIEAKKTERAYDRLKFKKGKK